jgi:uncharacterized repeat protein (TIGR03803 family)
MKTSSVRLFPTRSFPATYCIGLLLLWLAALAPAHAQTLTTLYNFCPSEPYCGSNPNGGLVQATDGNFYGTTEVFSYEGAGTVFEVTQAGVLTSLYTFGGVTDGGVPTAGLVQASNGSFYGTTSCCGVNGNYGTVFEITAVGALTTLHSFDGTDGSAPAAGLVQGTNGDFYGTTEGGGKYDYGTVFRVTSAGKFTMLHGFVGTDGKNPVGALVQGSNGNFYGTTNAGGAGYGTVFEITSAGKLTTLHSFDYSDGNGPYGGLVLGTDGNLYGTTEGGGANSDGTLFVITPSGTLNVLHNFCSSPNCTDGNGPQGALIQATDGNFYGTTTTGGMYGDGTAFEITPAGALTTLYSFNLSDGSLPQDGLLQATDGNLYGTTFSGGTYSGGTAFQLSVGLGPFVKLLETSGKVGTTVYIVGTSLAGASNVAFNSTPAKFTVLSATEIKTTVPKGASTGLVTVTTPSGTLSSNKVFVVPPKITTFSPTSAAVGAVVTISGQIFTGATSVTFGGVQATSFTVNSDSQITATVPTAAQTGKITVTTPSGTATSTGTFIVD